jgi:hypothetical protein
MPWLVADVFGGFSTSWDVTGDSDGRGESIDPATVVTRPGMSIRIPPDHVGPCAPAIPVLARSTMMGLPSVFEVTMMAARLWVV